MRKHKKEYAMKKLNEKQKKIINIVVTSLQICVVLLAVILSAIILANPNIANAEIGKANTKLLPVLTDSMKGDKKDSFNEGDLVVAKTPKDVNALEIGDIVTFKMKIGGVDQLNTHRIIEKATDANGKVRYVTKGDNTTGADAAIAAEEVLAVYQYHLKGVGGAIKWLQIPTNFLLVIVLPLIALFIYNIILFVKMMMQAKLAKIQTQQGDAIAIDEEEIKRKAIEDYLASKKEASDESADEE